jgi:DMSO/TMAO reductase YedYZ molybdopterin-dependent catalytic subunit
VVGRQLRWEDLDSRITPNDEFFTVKHYDLPVLSRTTWRLSIGGLVGRPLVLTLSGLQRRPRHEVEFTLECSGNSGLPFFQGGVGNARWAGARLRSLLRAAQPQPSANEVVFWGADRGEVTVRDNPGITGGGRTGRTEQDATGGLDLTITERFARSMSLEDALAPDNLVAYEMNGAVLPREHGYPARLIAPGWYGVANVKWLTRMELVDRPFQGRFMARDYVTVREEQRSGDTVWTFTTVTRDRLKSAPARVTRTGNRYTVTGAAWGAPVDRVEVQVDGGPWRAARLQRQLSTVTGAGPASGYSWRLWTFDWGTPARGEHTVRSRAHSVGGAVQPTPQDPFLASRRTFWEANGQITRRVVIR